MTSDQASNHTGCETPIDPETGSSPMGGAASSEGGPRVVVIGGGMAGILTAIQLAEAGYRHVQIIEKGQSLGGVWRDNRYPGLRCDVPSRMFCYSFSPNADYSARFATGQEILAYLQRTAQQYHIDQQVRFGATIQKAVWAEDHWRLTTDQGTLIQADVVICCTGILHTPRYPEIPGIDDFQGTQLHSARWPASLSLAGKRVGVIGSGSTAVQLVPQIAELAEHAVVFQRTPQWIFPMPNRRYRDIEKRFVRLVPGAGRLFHYAFSKLFQWSFSQAMLGSEPHASWVRWQCLRHLNKKVRDPRLRAKLTPTDDVGCKRLVHGKGFYQALQRDNTILETGAIERIVPDGVQMHDGTHHRLDTLVFATGYHAHHFMRPMEIVGEGGLTLEQAWRDGTTSHRSVALPGFPNLFMTLGPYSPIGNYSAISVAEVQVRYILQLLEQIRRKHCDVIHPQVESCERYMSELDAATRQTAWYSGCQSWYLDANGRTAMWPWSFGKFRRSMNRPRLSEYVLKRLSD